ncbi:MAG: hypothetical protein WA865_04195 [Spirulinaceae cyanobacterium]
MSQSPPTKKLEKISCPGLSLTKYREIAAHLQQVEGIQTNLIPQTSSEFDYNQSQVEGLLLSYTEDFLASNQEQVEAILSYYAKHCGDWLRE